MSNKVITVPNFTVKQMQWLEKQFPEIVHTPTSTNDELRHYFGQRSVLAVIRNRVVRTEDV